MLFANVPLYFVAFLILAWVIFKYTINRPIMWGWRIAPFLCILAAWQLFAITFGAFFQSFFRDYASPNFWTMQPMTFSAMHALLSITFIMPVYATGLLLGSNRISFKKLGVDMRMWPYAGLLLAIFTALGLVRYGIETIFVSALPLYDGQGVPIPVALPAGLYASIFIEAIKTYCGITIVIAAYIALADTTASDAERIFA
jgi:hypothetical protein